MCIIKNGVLVSVNEEDLTNGVFITPSGVEKIQSYAFFGSYVNEIVFSEEVNTIDAYGLAGCKSLIEINLPKTIKNIGIGCFRGCESINKIKFPNNNDYVSCRYIEQIEGLFLEQLVISDQNYKIISGHRFSEQKNKKMDLHEIFFVEKDGVIIVNPTLNTAIQDLNKKIQKNIFLNLDASVITDFFPFKEKTNPLKKDILVKDIIENFYSCLKLKK